MVEMNENGSVKTERRQYTRTSVRFGPTIKYREEVGQLVNVSSVGLAFDYVQLQNAQSIELHADEHLSVTYLDHELNELVDDKIPCRVVSDQVIGLYPEINGFVIRRKSVTFKDLSHEDREKIVTNLLEFSKEKQIQENDAFCPSI